MPCAVQRAIAASPLGRCETSHRHSRPSLDEMSRDLSCGTLVNQSPRVNFAKFDCVHVMTGVHGSPTPGILVLHHPRANYNDSHPRALPTAQSSNEQAPCPAHSSRLRGNTDDRADDRSPRILCFGHDAVRLGEALFSRRTVMSARQRSLVPLCL